MIFLGTFYMPLQSCLAWHESGHHIVALLAFDLLNPDEQQELLSILKDHPRFLTDFAPYRTPADARPMTETERAYWLIGRAGYWPDVARSQMEYSRPTWHYQLGASLIIGDVRNVPENPGPVPITATLATQELHIAQALEVCRTTFRNKSLPTSERAVALCWILHLVGDAHQPCHAGSLYARAFPDGDRGANMIPTKQMKNLHALWDGLLGSKYDAGDIRRRCEAIRSDSAGWKAADAAATTARGLDPLMWLEESANAGRSYVYTTEILDPVEAVSRGLTNKVSTIDLSEVYLKNAGELARARAAFAGQRLSRILKQDLQN